MLAVVQVAVSTFRNPQTAGGKNIDCSWAFCWYSWLIRPRRGFELLLPSAVSYFCAVKPVVLIGILDIRYMRQLLGQFPEDQDVA